MSLTLKRQFVPAVDEAAIASFEESVGFRLPEEYRGFLAECNGGQRMLAMHVWRAGVSISPRTR